MGISNTTSSIRGVSGKETLTNFAKVQGTKIVSTNASLVNATITNMRSNKIVSTTASLVNATITNIKSNRLVSTNASLVNATITKIKSDRIISPYYNLTATTGASGCGIRNNSGVVEKKDLGQSWNPITGYVPRGSVASFDFNETMLTLDGTEYNLDLSSLIPIGTQLVHIFIYIQDNSVNQFFYVYTKGNANLFNRSTVRTQVANIAMEADIWITPSADRQITYAGSAGIGTIDFVVKGWII